MKKTNHYDIVCPKCKATIHIPAYKEIRTKQEEELDKEINHTMEALARVVGIRRRTNV